MGSCAETTQIALNGAIVLTVQLCDIGRRGRFGHNQIWRFSRSPTGGARISDKMNAVRNPDRPPSSRRTRSPWPGPRGTRFATTLGAPNSDGRVTSSSALDSPSTASAVSASGSVINAGWVTGNPGSGLGRASTSRRGTWAGRAPGGRATRGVGAGRGRGGRASRNVGAERGGRGAMGTRGGAVWRAFGARPCR